MTKDKNIVLSADEQKYYAQGQDWETERLREIEKSKKLAWRVASVASVMAIIFGGALATLAPLKRVVPVPILVDKTTGNAEIVDAADDRTIVGYQELLDKHWTSRYVISRESYMYKILQTDYDNVLALSDDTVGQDYARLYDGPNARDKKYGAGIEMRVKVVSVSIEHDAVSNKAVVRFEKTTKRVDAEQPEPPQYFVATMSYEYKPSMAGKEKDLIQNPLGFHVTSYRVDSEIAPMAAQAASAAK